MSLYRNSSSPHLPFRELLPWMVMGVLIYGFFLWICLVLGYNGYKELIRGFVPLTDALKDSMTANFPWTILTFSFSYGLLFLSKKRRNVFLGLGQYFLVFSITGLILNLFFSTKGKNVLIPLNLALTFCIILLTISIRLRNFLTRVKWGFLDYAEIQDWVPPIIYRILVKNLPKTQTYFKEKPSAPFIIGFMTLLSICAILLIWKAERAAEQLANFAYFLLVIGVGIEVYTLIKYGENDSNDNKR